MPGGRQQQQTRGKADHRSRDRLKRRRGLFAPQERILIMCLGKTEARYLTSLIGCVGLTAVRIESTSVAPITLVDEAILAKRERERWDEVWCVFDIEGTNRQPSTDKAIHKAQEADIYLALSNPCIEFWYLLHFLQTDRVFHGAEDTIDALKQQFGAYNKNCDAFASLWPRVEEALNHADWLANRQDDSSAFPIPSTTMHRLIRRLRSLVRS